MSGLIGRGSGLWGKSGLITPEFRNANQPCFRAGRGSNYAHTGGDRIIFDTAGGGYFFNIGGHFDTSSGQFTAPVAGVYWIFANVIYQDVTDGTDMADSIRIKISGTTMAYPVHRMYYKTNYSGTAGYFVDALCTLCRVSANDTIEVLGQKTETVHGNSEYCRFEGYLLG